MDTMLATKQGMQQTFVNNARVGASVLMAGPCVVTQVKSEKKDGYWGVQLGLGTRKIKNTTKPLQGHLKGVTDKTGTPRFLREVRLKEEPTQKIGEVIKVTDVFAEGDTVDVTGVSKGKGFAGGMKRWGFKGGPKTHGQSDRSRAPGSIGQGTSPGRVWKGKKMAGRMGNSQVTVKHLRVISVDADKNTLSLSGPVPGIPGGLLVVKRVNERKEEPSE
ncbi:50S ribosomal protein L3 [Candidatus Woesebacteria bacterium RIFCSPHIGHO2_01_FULL_41_10]|uniref:Large ribosomal subunit protein uL3 n=1 Tax=Candidatus Woesebacteria bacterium RIFCSPHIGHO2_01_FULL_41_10 TaxID=1802500 RepID=A0A1F7YSL1_9BACT|nr:MAG: 50S ribosomal protein L3 [Candidatus Woesebacteria bacterium RIFCSPHIGHO2_01_FULL_41_10]